MPIDERFAYVSLEDGRKFQVLLLVADPETGDMIPVDWDEAATAALIAEAST